MKVYGVYDIAAEQFACCFTCSSDVQAERMFFDLLTNPEDSLYTLHPGDFALILVSDFDDSKVQISDFISSGSKFTKEVLVSRRFERCEYLRKYKDIMNSSL